MKRLIILAAAALTFGATTANAQRALSKDGVGLNIGYSGFNENAGIGVHYRMGLGKGFRFEPAFNYYFENDGKSQWDLMGNFHYVIPVGKRVGVYPLVGLGIAGLHHEWYSDDGLYGHDRDETKVSFTMNFGAGLEVPVTSNFSLGVDLKGQYISWDGVGDHVQFVPTFKFTYLF